MNANTKKVNCTQLTAKIKQLGKDFGFEHIGICDVSVTHSASKFEEWLAQCFHGDMKYLEKYRLERLHPDKLVPHTKSIICCSRRYAPPVHHEQPIASFALGKNYPRMMRSHLKAYANELSLLFKELKILRVFSGSAPLLEKALATQAGLGWQGKNTLFMNSHAGSYLFLGEIFIDLALPADTQTKNRCGNCIKCLAACPTKAIIAPYKLDARRCISYLTIEHKETIPHEFREPIGTRIFGCDACQFACPWNRFAHAARETFSKHSFALLHSSLREMFAWDEKTYRERTSSTPLKRLSYECWLRNLAVALGNSNYCEENLHALHARLNFPSQLVREHVEWAVHIVSQKARRFK